MKERTPEDFSNLSMLDLFRIEAENQTGVLTSTLLEMEKAARVKHFETPGMGV